MLLVVGSNRVEYVNINMNNMNMIFPAAGSPERPAAGRAAGVGGAGGVGAGERVCGLVQVRSSCIIIITIRA